MFRLLLLLELFLYHSYTLNITNWSRYHDMENMRHTKNIGLLTTHSVITCAVECANIPSCMSYSYHAGNNNCLLYSVPFTTETTGAVGEDGWTSYNSMCDNGPKNPDYFYKPNLQMCYQLETDKANITEAMSNCSVSGRLLRIDSIEKQGHVEEFLDFSSAQNRVYIGGTSAKQNDFFSYEDGTPMTWFFWSPGNPQGNKAIVMRRRDSYKWRNVHGADPRQYLCEIVL